MKRVFITGGAGFIGSEIIRFLVRENGQKVLNYDKLTYAGNLESLSDISDKNYHFINGDINNYELVNESIKKFEPDIIMHLAAESHVDRSIDGPAEFISTNVMGTFTMLQAARHYWLSLPEMNKTKFRFHHVSTDEVFGSLGETGAFSENTNYDPSSPYSASKAAADHLVRSWNRTYGLPTLITNCSNNYGPFQFPEKLIPLMILNALDGKPLPIYGNGKQVRDWLYVNDHAKALWLVATKGQIGHTYNIGGHNEKTNLEVVNCICEILDKLRPQNVNNNTSYKDLITFVEDRPGHDKRYAIDATKIRESLGWMPEENFESGLRKTINWYISNSKWCSNIFDGSYKRERLGKS